MTDDDRRCLRDAARGVGRALWLLVFLLGLMAASLLLPTSCESQATALELEAALALARYGANEAGLEAPADQLMIWQAAESHGRTLERRLRWLRRHSSCVVAAVAPPSWPPGNCRWARFLDRSGSSPRNWPYSDELWIEEFAELWAGLLELALRVVRGEELARPCDGHPQTWDGWRWSELRLAEGFTIVPCANPWTGEPLRNAAYRFPHWRAAQALRARRRTPE